MQLNQGHGRKKAIMKDFYEDTLLARFDELLDKEENGLTPEESDELDALSEWYEAWIDYAQATDNLRRWYEKH